MDCGLVTQLIIQVWFYDVPNAVGIVCQKGEKQGADAGWGSAAGRGRW